MKIGNATDPMARFLEAKKAAEIRMNGGSKSASDVSKPSGTNSPEAFLNMLAEIRGKAFASDSKIDNNITRANSIINSKPVGSANKAKVMEEAKGLLSVYNINRALGSHMTESNSAAVVKQNKHLGSFFDAVA